MVKGFRNLDRYLTNWCKSNGFKVKCRMGTDFSYNLDDNILYYTLAVPCETDTWFVEEFSKYLHNIESCDSFIMSFFHELGHYETKDDFDDCEWCDYFDYVEQLESTSGHTRKGYNKYFNTEIEKAATLWACEYIDSNTDIISDFFDGLKPLVIKFFRDNKIEDWIDE